MAPRAVGAGCSCVPRDGSGCLGCPLTSCEALQVQAELMLEPPCHTPVEDVIFGNAA
jgi:hypothetical protein